MEKKSIQIKDLLSVSNIDEINTLISQLSSEEKAELMQKLLGRSGLMVVLGGSNVTTSDLVIQIHSTANLDLSDLLRAIATRIVEQKPSKDKKKGDHN
jgi:predicted membrane-bound spermidine synthase